MPPRCWLPRRSWRLEHNHFADVLKARGRSPLSESPWIPHSTRRRTAPGHRGTRIAPARRRCPLDPGPTTRSGNGRFNGGTGRSHPPSPKPFARLTDGSHVDGLTVVKCGGGRSSPRDSRWHAPVAGKGSDRVGPLNDVRTNTGRARFPFNNFKHF